MLRPKLITNDNPASLFTNNPSQMQRENKINSSLNVY